MGNVTANAAQALGSLGGEILPHRHIRKAQHANHLSLLRHRQAANLLMLPLTLLRLKHCRYLQPVLLRVKPIP